MLTESTDIFGIPLHEDALEEAEYQGRSVTLNKCAFRTMPAPRFGVMPAADMRAKRPPASGRNEVPT